MAQANQNHSIGSDFYAIFEMAKLADIATGRMADGDDMLNTVQFSVSRLVEMLSMFHERHEGALI